jgi:predicted enzyme involved in methoxymalonyl-ACP biosynthesis
VVFVDDSPYECAEVLSHCPEVLTVCVPRDPSFFTAFLDQLWALDAPLLATLTAEDRTRTQLYHAEVQRNRLRTAAGSMSAFRASLALWVDVQPMDIDSAERVAQLTDRTNQHNACKRSWSAEELLAMQARGTHEVFTATAGDRFASHGLVGAMVVRLEPAEVRLRQSDTANEEQIGTGVLLGKAAFRELEPPATVVLGVDGCPAFEASVGHGDGAESIVESLGESIRALWVEGFMLSCRALHIGVEHAMVRHLGSMARTLGATHLAWSWLPAPRNEPARAFLFMLGSAYFLATTNSESARSSSPDVGVTAAESAADETPTESAADESAAGESTGGTNTPFELGPEHSGLSKRDRNRCVF